MPETSSSGPTTDSQPEWIGKAAVVGAVVAGLALAKGKGVGVVLGGAAAAAGLTLLSGRRKDQDNSHVAAEDGITQRELIIPINNASVPTGMENASLDEPVLAETVEHSKSDIISLSEQALNDEEKCLGNEEKPEAVLPSPAAMDDDFAHFMGPMIWEAGPELQSLSYSESETVWYGLNKDYPPLAGETTPPTEHSEVEELTITSLFDSVSEETALDTEHEDEIIEFPSLMESFLEEPEIEKSTIFTLADEQPEQEDHQDIESTNKVDSIQDENPFKIYPKVDDPFLVNAKEAQSKPTPRKLLPVNTQLTRLLPNEDVEVKDVDLFDPIVPRHKIEPFAPGTLTASKNQQNGGGWWWMTVVIVLVVSALAVLWWQDRGDQSWSLPFSIDASIVEDAFSNQAEQAEIKLK